MGLGQRNTLRRTRRSLAFGILLVGMGWASASTAQGPPAAGAGPQGPPTGPLQVQQLTPTVYWAKGGVGNVGFIIGDKGVTVIDTTISVDKAKELLADIAKVTPKPVTTVILTHGDTDHVSGLGAFPAGITIIAQENTRKHMEQVIAGGHSRVPADHLPNHLVSVPEEDIVLDGVKLELLHWAPAHTNGDLVIFLPDQKVVFTGDIFALDQARPLIHTDQHGSSEGWITSAQGIVALKADRFVVGHGDVQTKQALEDRIQQAITERDQIKKLVAEGKTLPEIQAAVGDPPPGESKPGPGPRFDPYSAVVYQELTQPK